MYAYLGVVEEKNYQKGIMIPSYVLCHAVSSDGTTSLYIERYREGHQNLALVPFSTIYHHDEMILAMQNRRSVSDNLKRVVCGMLCWYPCDIYGNMMNKEYPVFVKMVPDKSVYRDDVWFYVNRELSKQPKILEVLARDYTAVEMPELHLEKFERKRTDGNKET